MLELCPTQSSSQRSEGKNLLVERRRPIRSACYLAPALSAFGFCALAVVLWWCLVWGLVDV